MKELFAKNSQEFNDWLQKHHATEKEIMLVLYKKATGKPSITWAEAVVEALKFGWIDGIRKGLGEETHAIRFTPRKPSSIWSSINKETVERLIKEDKIYPSGLAAVEIAKKNGQWETGYRLSGTTEVPEDLEKALGRNKKALEFFNSLSNTNKFSYIYPVAKLKGAELRKERIKKVVALCAKGIKPHVDGKSSLKS